MRTHWLLAAAISSIVVGCGTQPASSRSAADSILRVELLERGRVDQAVRQVWMEKLQRNVKPDSADWVRTLVADSANTDWLKETVRTHGWPGRSHVGPEAAGAAFLIVQHSPDTAFQREMLDLIRQAVEAGEVDGQALALLTDRVEVQAGRPQIYGTQAKIIDGQVMLDPIDDSAHVDERRTQLGLQPLAEYVRLLDSAYTPRGRLH